MLRSIKSALYSASFLMMIVFAPVIQAETAKQLEYQIKWHALDADYAYLDVTFILMGSANGQTRIRLPESFAGVGEQYRQVYDLKVNEGHIENERKGYYKIIHHKPNQKLVISYQLRPNQTTRPFFTHDVRKPLVFRDYMHIVAKTAFITPVEEATTEYNVKMDWQLPKDWALYSSVSEAENSFEEKMRLSEFKKLLFIAGDYEITKLKLSNQTFTVALKGPFSFTAKELEDELTPAYQSINTLFKNEVPKNMLISLISLPQKRSASSGISLHQAMMGTFSDRRGINRSMMNLLIHEYLHKWNTSRLFVDNKSSQRQYTWFVEGFTIYLTKIIMMKHGHYDYPRLVRRYNDVLEAYFTSSAINLPNDEIYERFNTSAAVHVIPDQRGRIIAHNMNVKIKELYPQKGFNDYFAALVLPRVRSNFTEHKLTWDKLNEVSLGYSKDGFEDMIKKYIIKGQTIPIHPQSMGPCAVISSKTVPELVPGLDISMSRKKGYLMGVIKDGPAYKAGLREEQRIKSISWSRTQEQDPAEVPVVVRLNDNGKKVIFYPTKLGEKVIPYFVVDEEQYMRDEKACERWFY